MLIKPDSKIILMGDSVTDAGRVRPCGEGIADGFGVGYANIRRNVERRLSRTKHKVCKYGGIGQHHAVAR